MDNHWAITIGINQYRHLQPLKHAQNDALFIHRFLTEEAGIPGDRCVLLSDLTTSVGHQVVYPDKPAIAEWVQTITQQVQANDIVWVFFSGYGVQHNGADYLMPIDGDPQAIEHTGLALSQLMDRLASLPTDKILLLLDINRSQGALAGQTIGTQAIELAQRHRIATFLSCQPEQYSHETLGVRHGLFTAALLEALSQQHRTLGNLSHYLTQRLPELCEHHWRPIQNPACLIPEGQEAWVVVPERRLTADMAEPAQSTAFIAGPSGVTQTETFRAQQERSEAARGDRARYGGGVGTLSGSEGGTLSPGTSALGPASTGTLVVRGANRSRGSSEGDEFEGTGSSAIVPYHAEAEAPGISGAKLRNWGLLILALLMGAALLKQPFVKAAWQGLLDRRSATAPTESAPKGEPTAGVESPMGEVTQGTPAATPPLAQPNASGTQSGAATTAPAQENQQGGQESLAQPSTPASPGSPAEANSPGVSAAVNPNDAAAAKELVARATAALEKRQFSEALIALQEVPQGQRNQDFVAILTKARVGAARAEEMNASLLTEARTSIQPTQASQFTEAIAKASQIKPGEPYYEAAQRDIRSWSQVILDIAEGRATSGNLEGAIAAAKVMPYESPEFRQKAQDRITFWQQRQRSREIIEEAKTIPKMGQASTYQKGIVKLREVPIEHPEYETAQRLADEWSGRIFSIAQARAAQGKKEAAIEAAILVPAGTTAYEPTQQAIRRWRSE